MSESSDHTVPATASPLEILAAEIGADMARIERECQLRIAAGLAEIREGMAALQLRAITVERDLTEKTSITLASVRNGEPGPPGEVPTLDAPDDLAPMIARALSLLAEAPALVPPLPPPPVVNVTVPQPAPRTERSRVKHDAQGRVVAIERDIA